MNRLKVAIIGNGRFGKTLSVLLRDDFMVTCYAHKDLLGEEEAARVYENEVIFYAVPIEAFDKVIATHKKHFRKEHVLIDVCSVKMHPKKVLEKHLFNTQTQALLTHPMFGPDSCKNGFSNLTIVIDRFKTSESTYIFWKEFFLAKGLKVVELSAKDHDKLAAESQGLAHFMGRVLDAYGLEPTPIDTLGVKKLLELREQTCNDTWQLFANLQHYNPFTRSMRMRIGEAFNKIDKQLEPMRPKTQTVRFGIQGGVGSFNEEAIRYYLKRNNIQDYKIEYLYTSENVMKALDKGEIDFGQFAMHNSAGGLVQESIEAMATHLCRVVDQYAIVIAHALMIRPDTLINEIDTIMTHPQVLGQCKNTLFNKYPHLKQTSGTGIMIDHALVAKSMSEKKLPKNMAVMGSKVLAEIYNLTIVEDNLQDLAENYTTFLLVGNI